MQVTRRAFLSGLLASCASLHAQARRSRAADRPLRFVGVFTPHGMIPPLFVPRGNFDLRFEHSVLSPFDDAETHGQSFRDQLLVLDGLDLTAGILAGTTGHDASRAILTGSGASGTNASLDRALAVQHGLGRATPVSNLVLGVGDPSLEVGHCMSYAEGKSPLPKLIDPRETFALLFGAPGAGQAQLEQLRMDRRSVIDLVLADLEDMRRRESAQAAALFEQHLQSVRELERRLEGFDLTCEPPSTLPALGSVRAGSGGEPAFDLIIDLQIDLMAEALACGLTRFSTLFLPDLSRTRMFPGLPDDVHVELAHRYQARASHGTDVPETWQKLAVQHRYAYGKVARLMQKLQQRGALADTLILVASDVGDPQVHSSRRVPVLLAGGAGGRFRMGRYVHVDPHGTGVPHNRLLVSIARAFGVALEAFGSATDPTVTAGALNLS
jgi:hypothetical protein